MYMISCSPNLKQLVTTTGVTLSELRTAAGVQVGQLCTGGGVRVGCLELTIGPRWNNQTRVGIRAASASASGHGATA